MGWHSRVSSLFRNLLHRPRVERDLDAELRAYVALAADERRARGDDGGEARRAALVELQSGGEQPHARPASRPRRFGASTAACAEVEGSRRSGPVSGSPRG
jgi:hypothetical protein